MKIYTNSFDDMISIENIFHAWDKFKKGKRNKKDVQIFEFNLEDNLFNLHDALKQKTYYHNFYHGFYIHDSKVRLIHKAMVQDRIIHHIMYQSLNPIFEPTFIADSFSCRKNKGTHKAVERLRYFLRKKCQTNRHCFVLKCDINKFFASIDHKILLSLVQKKIKDRNVLWLVKSIIESFPLRAVQRERERERESKPTSPVYCNERMPDRKSYLSAFCKYLFERTRPIY